MSLHVEEIGSATNLLGRDEPLPVAIDRPQGASAILLVCDHAGRRVPAALADLGLPDAEFERHIAWDIGAQAVSRLLSEALDATLVRQIYSRLVIDCNRPLEATSSIPEISESTVVPGNRALPKEAREARQAEIFTPYHMAIAAELDRRAAMGRPAHLVAMHSFTPVYKGETRPWQIGTLYGRDPRFAKALFDLLIRDEALVVGDNQPYNVSAGTDYTIPMHGERRGLIHVGIEIRQDLIAGEAGQIEWASRLADLLPRAAQVVAAAG